LKVTAEFVTSAAGASGFPSGELPEIALVGRSNVGKSSLINALAARRIARTSAAPGKTRLANLYRVSRGNAGPLYLVDLPGYGYTRGSRDAAREFDELTRAYFERGRVGQTDAVGQVGKNDFDLPSRPDPPDREAHVSALLLVDVRHPGLHSDRRAWQWLQTTVARAAVVATKIDKLPRGQRIRAVSELESVFEDSVLPCSAVTGEGLENLWNLIERLANSRNPQPPRSRNSNNRLPPKATAARPPTK
jgi:GTP-binding protein